MTPYYEHAGIEIEERYCEIAARRMAQEVLAFREHDKDHVISAPLFGIQESE